MKKIFVFVILFISLKGFSQYPNGIQTIGNDSNVVQPKGALKARIINFPYTDTTEANDQHIDEYAGAQIYTVTGDAFWLRDQTATRWIFLFRGADSVFVSDDLYVDELLNPGYQTIRRWHNDGLVSGGIVTWTGTGLRFAISAAVYYLNQVRYTTLADTITLDPADVSLGRIDAFVVDTIPGIDKITGTAAADPVTPQEEPTSQIVLATILLNAGDLVPSNVIVNKIYDENIEWAPSTTGTLTIDYNDTNNPYIGSKAVFVSVYNNNSKLRWTYAGTHTIGNGDVLTMRFYSNGAFLNKLRFQFYNTNTAASNSLQINSGFGLNPIDSNNYQFIDIPLSAFVFNPGVTGFNRLVITNVGNDLSGAKGYYIDNIQLQSGINNVPPQVDYSNKLDSVTITKTTVGTDTSNVFKTYVKGLSKTIGTVWTGGGGAVYTADNGLTMASNNVKWGGTALSANSTVPTSAFSFTTNSSNATQTFKSINSSSGRGLYGTSTSGIGVEGLGTSGFGLVGTSVSGTGVQAVSESGLPLEIVYIGSQTNSIINTVDIEALSTGTAANGFGARWDFRTQTSTGASPNSNQITSYWSNATHASRTSGWILAGVDNAVTADLLTISGSGATRLNKYGVGTFTGTAAYSLAVDASGNIIEDVAGGGGGGGTTTDEVITATAGQTAFSFTGVPVASADFQVFVNGQKWHYTTGYTHSGNVVTVTTPLAVGDLVNYHRIK